MERLTPRVRIVWVIFALVKSLFVGGVLVGGASGMYLSGPWETPIVVVWVALLLAVTIVVFRVLVAWRRYTIWRFDLQEDALYIERGVFTRVKTVAPYVRIQHVDTRRSPIERGVGLATLVVYTAGSRSADVAIPGLTPERAEGLRETLRRVTIESEGGDAV